MNLFPPHDVIWLRQIDRGRKLASRKGVRELRMVVVGFSRHRTPDLRPYSQSGAAPVAALPFPNRVTTRCVSDVGQSQLHGDHFKFVINKKEFQVFLWETNKSVEMVTESSSQVLFQFQLYFL